MDVLPPDQETGCCKRFDPVPWHNKELTLEDKLFVKDHVQSIFHIPLNYGKVMLRNMEKIEAAGALADQPLMLSDESSNWGSDIYIAVSKDVPDSEMVHVRGRFLARVYEGSFNKAAEWVEDMKGYLLSEKKKLKKMFFFYTTCPACAKAYGKNYVVLLAQIAD